MYAKWVARVVWLLFLAACICLALASYFRAQAALTLLSVRDAQLGQAQLAVGQREQLLRQCAVYIEQQNDRYAKCATLRKCP